MDYELMGGDARSAIIEAEDKKYGIPVCSCLRWCRITIRMNGRTGANPVRRRMVPHYGSFK